MDEAHEAIDSHVSAPAPHAGHATDQELTDGLAGKANASHVHSGADVTSGTVAPERIGTGTPGAGKYVDGGTGAWTALPSGGGYVPQTHIEGLALEWVSANSLRATSGSAYVPGLSGVLEVPSAITKSGLVFAASTFYYVYLYSSAGVADLEVSTAPAAAPYRGSARTKGGASPDNTRRYLGAVLSDSSGTPGMWNFLRAGNAVKYRSNQGASPFRVLSSGVATAETAVSCSGVVPPTSRLASLRLINTTDQTMRTGTSDDSATPGMAALNATASGGTVSQAFLDHPLDASQALVYSLAATPSTGSAIVDVYGYVDAR